MAASLLAMIGSSGKAKKGEDRAAVLDANIHGERVMFGLVADGHGGKEIAVQCAEELLPWVVKHAADGSGGSLNAAVVAAFRHMHEKACAIADCIAGTTLTVAALNVPRREVSAWNVGDSLAMLVHEGGYEVLSQSHRLDDSIAEQERVQQLGAKLGRAMDAQGQPGGPLRCWPGGLAVTRTIGDSDCKECVSCEPFMSEPVTPTGGGAIVLCSDGVWDSLRPEEVSALLLKGEYDGPSRAAEKIVKAVVRRGLTDDTTAVVLLFGPAPSSESGDSSNGSGVNLLDPGTGTPASGRSFLRRLSHDNEDKSAPSPAGGSFDRKDGDSTSSTSSARRSVLNAAGLISGAGSNASAPSTDVTTKGGVAFAGVGQMADPASISSTTLDADDGRGPDSARRGLSGLGRRNSVRMGSGVDAQTADADSTGGGGTPSDSPAPHRSGIRRMTAVLTNQFDSLLRGASGTGASLGNSGSSGLGARVSGGPGNSGSGHQRAMWTVDGQVRDGGSPPSPSRSPGQSRSPKGARMRRGSSSGNASDRGLPWAGARGSANVATTSCRHEDGAGGGAAGGEQTSSSSSGEVLARPGPPLEASFLNPGMSKTHDPRRPSLTREELAANIDNAPKARVVEYKDLDPAMKYLGQGEFATAWRTKLHGEPVAIKMIKKEKLELKDALAGLKREIMLMTLMVHKNVLPGLALGQLEGKPFMVLKILNSVLINDLPRPSESVPFWVRWRETKRWPLSRAMSYAIQLGSALRYCHHEAFSHFRVLHRDIKPANIGFLHDGTLVLFDFGLAALWTLQTGTASDAPRPLTGETGSLRYMAPEVATNQPYNHKADVFSFADVFWEMMAWRKPFENFTPQYFLKAIAEGRTPEIKKKWPAPLQRLLTDCWALDMNARPDFRQIVPRLEVILGEQIVAETPKTKKSKRSSLLTPRANTPATAETAAAPPAAPPVRLAVSQ